MAADRSRVYSFVMNHQFHCLLSSLFVAGRLKSLPELQPVHYSVPGWLGEEKGEGILCSN